MFKSNRFIQLIDEMKTNPTTKFFWVNKRCAYYYIGEGQDTKRCINLKHKIKDLIDNRVITFQAPTPYVNLNPLSNYGVAIIDIIEKDED